MYKSIVLLLSLSGCLSVADTTYGAKYLSKKDVRALELATADWNEACGLNLGVVVSGDGDITVKRTSYPIDCNKSSTTAIGCARSSNGETHIIEIASEPGFPTRQTLAHEIGHSLGLSHKSYGIMQPAVPMSKDAKVSRKDCGDW